MSSGPVVHFLRQTSARHIDWPLVIDTLRVLYKTRRTWSIKKNLPRSSCPVFMRVSYSEKNEMSSGPVVQFLRQTFARHLDWPLVSDTLSFLYQTGWAWLDKKSLHWSSCPVFLKGNPYSNKKLICPLVHLSTF